MDKKKRISLIVLIVGIAILAAGVIFLVLRLVTENNKVPDGEYLVARRTWLLDESATARGDARSDTTAESDTQDDASYVTNCGGSNLEETNCEDVALVVWDVDEIGKGKLTTNGGLDEYDFIWAIEGNKLKIETDWFYPLENEYQYFLDQNAGKLELTDGEKNIISSASSKSLFL